MSGRSPPLYCTLTLIAMQGHQTKTETMYYVIKQGSNNILLFHRLQRQNLSIAFINGFPDGGNLGAVTYLKTQNVHLLFGNHKQRYKN